MIAYKKYTVRDMECKIKLIEVKDRKSKLEVQITEGKNREIRKIFDKFYGE